MRLLADAGRTDGAALVRAAVAADIVSQGKRLGINEGPALRALAITADLLGDGKGAEIWTRLEVQHLGREEPGNRNR